MSNVAFGASTKVSTAGTLVTVSNGTGSSDTLNIADAPSETYRVASGAGGGTALFANSEVSSLSSSRASGTGSVGSTIDFFVSLPGSLTTAGSPVLLLSDGGTASYKGTYTFGADQSFEFATTVSGGQNTTDLKVTGASLNGAVFTDTSGAPVDFSRVATLAGSDTGLIIDTTPPAAPTSLTLPPASDSGVVGDNTTNSPFSTIAGSAEPGAMITIFDNGAFNSATYQFFPVTSADQFALSVHLAEGVNNLTAVATDAAGNVSAPSSVYSVTLDDVAPTITALSSTTSAAGTLGTGASVRFTLTVSAGVTVNTSIGSPTLTLSDGSTATYDAAASSATSLVFAASVLAGQATPDLKVTGLALNGAVPVDFVGNALSVSGVSALAGSDTGIAINTTPVPVPTPTPAPVGVTTMAGAKGGTVFTTVANASNSVTTSATGNDVVNSLGSDTVQAGGGFDIVYASGPAATVMGGAGNLTFVAGAGSYVAGGGAGVDILYGGNGPNVLTGGAAKGSIIVAGFGNTSLVGGAGLSVLAFGGFGASTFTGSAGGSDTLVGGAGANTFNMTSGDIAFGGPNGPDTYNTGSGSTLIVEGPGRSQVNVGTGLTTDFAGTGIDTYTITRGNLGIADIIGFKAGDHITLTGGFTAADASAAVSKATTGSFGTTLNLSDGTKVNLFGVTITASQVSVG